MKKLLAATLALLLTLAGTCPALATTIQHYSSDTLMSVCDAFTINLLTLSANIENVDVVGTNGIITYTDESITYSYDDVAVIHGGLYSEKNTISLGVGSGLEQNEDHWYMSLTFSPEASDQTVQCAGVSMFLACAEAGLQLPADTDEAFDIIWTLLDALFTFDEVAIELDGLVFVHKALDGGSHLLAVDSLAYYNGFYYNSISQYIKLD